MPRYDTPNKAYAEALALIRSPYRRTPFGAERTLDFSNFGLKRLPPEIKAKKEVFIIDLTGNQLSELPVELFGLKQLKVLNLTDNQFRSLPPDIGKLNLRRLLLSGNNLTALPPEIGELTELQMLDLEGNRLKVLPAEIGKLTSLRSLNLQNNRLEALPPELGQARALAGDWGTSMRAGIRLEGNPLTGPYPFFMQDDPRIAATNILKWLRGEFASTGLSSPTKIAESENASENIAPTEPILEPGPRFSLTSGKLDLISGPETSDAFDRATQIALQIRITKQIIALQEETLKVGNRHPGLARVVQEYSNLVNNQFDELDVVSIWALGNSLLAQATSFERQNEKRTLTEPLEPSHMALLVDVARLHGGFILGFPKGLELTARADHALLSLDDLRKFKGHTSHVLKALSQNSKLVSDTVQRFADAIQESLLVAGWETTRMGYTSYAVVRNALIQLGKALVWTNDKGGSVVGNVIAGSVIAGSGLPPETLDLVIRFLYSNASEILAFSAPFPELRAWIGWIIDHLDEEQKENNRL